MRKDKVHIRIELSPENFKALTGTAKRKGIPLSKVLDNAVADYINHEIYLRECESKGPSMDVRLYMVKSILDLYGDGKSVKEISKILKEEYSWEKPVSESKITKIITGKATAHEDTVKIRLAFRKLLSEDNKLSKEKRRRLEELRNLYMGL